jgi:hypothetical protein
MKTLLPKEFIKQVFINEVADLVENHPYLAFMIMGIGIELLGKSISSEHSDWDVEGKSRSSFEKAVKTLSSLKKYEPYLDKKGHDLYGSLRCGLAHSAKPKYGITLSSKNEAANLFEYGGRVNLRCEDFYSDFKAACEEVISMNFTGNDKMNNGFLTIPN